MITLATFVALASVLALATFFGTDRNVAMPDDHDPCAELPSIMAVAAALGYGTEKPRQSSHGRPYAVPRVDAHGSYRCTFLPRALDSDDPVEFWSWMLDRVWPEVPKTLDTYSVAL